MEKMCYLDGVDGLLDAEAIHTGKDWAGRDCYRVKALDGSKSISVLKTWAEHKFDGCCVPTFYYS